MNVKEKILPTNKISDNVCVAHKHGVRIEFLTRLRTMKIFSKRRLYSGPILEKL